MSINQWRKANKKPSGARALLRVAGKWGLIALVAGVSGASCVDLELDEQGVGGTPGEPQTVQCQPAESTEGAPCDDGQFCTTGDFCLGGSCVLGEDRACPATQFCDEGEQRCRCPGQACFVNGVCIASGLINVENPCEICDPARNPDGFSPRATASCGAPRPPY